MNEFFQKQNGKKRVNPPLLASLMMIAFASNSMATEMNIKSASSEDKKQSNKFNANEPSVNTLKSVVNLSFNKDGGKDVSVSANPEASEILVNLNSVDKTFKSPVAATNDPLIDKIYTITQEGKSFVVVKTKFPVKFNLVKSENKGTLLLEQSAMFINENSGEKFNTSKNAGLSGLSNNWSQISSPSSLASLQKKTSALNSANIEMLKVNLKKESGKKAKLSIELSSKVSAPVIKKEGNKLIVDFKNVSIPHELQRRVNAESLGTVTKSLDVTVDKNDGRLVLEQKDNWDYSFYQVENKVFIEINTVEKLDEEKKYVGKKLSISFQDMEVRAILQVISDFTGLNIMSSDKVVGTMTIRLKDVPWDQALDLVLESRGLQKVKDGNVIWVATSEEVTANNKAKLELKLQNTELEPLKLEFFQINYYKADELKKVLEGKSEGSNSNAMAMLSKRGTVGVDPRNNMLFIQDTEEKLKELRKLIKKLDMANKQVLVEAKIVLADSDFGRELGSKFGIRYRRQNGANGAVGIGGNIVESGNQAGGPVTITPQSDLAAKTGAAAIGLTLLNMASGNALGVELSALEINNRGKVLSSPRLLTADNKKAVIEQGTEVPYITPGKDGGLATVEFKKAVLKLEVTPQIAPNGKVVLELNIRKDSIGQLVNIQGGGQIPTIDTKNINTMVTVNNGQTVVLGGVYEIESRDDLSKIPFLGEIPVLGNLFKHKSKNEAKGELMIFITPHVIEEQDLDEAGKFEESPEINLSKN